MAEVRLSRWIGAAMLAVTGLTACAPDQPTGLPSGEPTNAPPGAPTQATPSGTITGAEAACTASLESGQSMFTVSFDGTEEEVLVLVPDSVQDGGAMVLDLHGSRSNGAREADLSGLDTVAQRAGFILVSPTGGVWLDSGDPRPDGAWAWNVPGVPTVDGEVPTDRDRDDVAFLAAVIEQVGQAGCVDPNRVFIAGRSGGGRMASAFACERADLVAAIAPVAGLRAGRARTQDVTQIETGTCAPTEPVAVVTFHGTDDDVNPFEGNGDPRWGYSVPDAIAQWARLNGCEAGPSSEPFGVGVDRIGYAQCRAGADVVGYQITGGGHTWPSSPIDASQLIWEFFATHPKNPG